MDSNGRIGREVGSRRTGCIYVLKHILNNYIFIKKKYRFMFVFAFLKSLILCLSRRLGWKQRKQAGQHSEN